MTFNISRKIVGVSLRSPNKRFELLFAALAQLYPLEFRQVQPGHAENLDAIIILDGDAAGGAAAATQGVPAYVVASEATPWAETADHDVEFSKSSCLDACLRGQTMRDPDRTTFCPQAFNTGDEVLAAKGRLPIWISRHCGRAACQLVGVSPPPLGQGEFLFQHLNGRRFLRLLPLIHFLRGISKDLDWRAPPPRACFVFDDPSLHRPSYGFLNFRHLAEHATKHNYFVSVATVPLDTWWVNSRVAETFHSFSPRLSLLVHGNNHTSHELLFWKNGESRLAQAAQALRRMERLERLHGLGFLKIMEAPHGAIAHETFEHLLSLGFEAALGTPEWLVRYNPNSRWPVSLGMDRSELLGGGLPVIPRIRMSPEWPNEVLLAVLLQQPIVLVGHHQDATNRLDLLARFADLVNSLDGVVWSSPQEMARANFKELRRGDEFHIKAYSRRMRLRPPEGVNHLFVHRPWPHPDGGSELIIRNSRQEEIFRAAPGEIAGPVSVTALDEIEIISPPPNPIDYRTLRSPKAGSWPVLRKVLMEMRDRSAPWRYRAGLVRRPAPRFRD